MVAAVTEGIRSDVSSDSDVGGGIFSSRVASSIMAPELVFPSPPSDGGLLRGEEVTRDEIIGVCAKGGKCDITTVPVVVVGAHGCRSVAALVHASRVASCPGACDLALSIPTLEVTAVAGGGGMVWGKCLSWRGS